MNYAALFSKYSKNLFVVLLLIVSSQLFGQTFQTAIGYPMPTDERGVSGLIANNGDYLMLGSNTSHPSGFFNPAGDMQLVRLDNLGNLIQPCKIIGQDVGESGVWFEKATDCTNTAGYIIAGNEFNGPAHNMLLTFTSAAGNPVWVKRIGTLNDDEQSACVKQDGSRNFILVGTKTDAGTGLSAIHAVKTDCFGNLIWERVYRLNVSVTATSVTAFATFQTACTNLPNEYFITGKTAASAIGNEEVLILSVNAATGAVSWMKTYDVAPAAGDVGTCIQGSCAGPAPAAGSLWVSGYSLENSGTDPKKVMMLQTDLSGNLLWANNYDVQNSVLENATHFQFAANGKLVLTGKAEDTGVSDPPENGQCMLMRMDNNGSTVDWTRVYTMGIASQGNRVEPNTADQYFITGHTLELITVQQYDYNMLAIKTDNLGETDASCFHSPETVIIPRQPVTTPVQPTPNIPQDFFGSSLLTVQYQEKQTFCPPQQIDPCDTLNLNASFTFTASGNTLSFSDLSTVGSGSIFSWNWDFGDSNTSSSQNPVHTYTGPGVYTICLIVSGGVNGILCRDTICKDIFIEIPTEGCLCDSSFYANVDLGFTTSGTNPIGFTPVALDTCDFVLWMWGDGFPNTNSTGNATVFHTYTTSGTYMVCMVVSRISITGQVCKREFCIPVEVVSIPQLCQDNIVLNGNFSAGLAPGNLGFGGAVNNWTTWTNSPQVIIGDTCQDAGAIQMWGNQVVGESIQQPVSFLMGGIYEISFCGKWLSTVQDSVRFRFRASTGLPGSYLNCSGTCDEMYLSPVLTTSWMTYTSAPWTAPQNFNTLTISVWNNFAINDGAYVSWGRIDDVCIRRIGTSATHEATGAVDATLFPNPTSGDVTIRFQETLDAETQISVMDLTGRTILHTTAEEGQSSLDLSLGNYPSGIYMVRALRGGRAVWAEKVVKE
ncbi:MAG: PKD domain-containing protein [Saprospiraceae bacterium]|nr:PKD domain-containing protein [Saprospiraceae bacterium]